MEYYQSLPQIPQRTPEWYQKRATILTSTQISSILHLNSFHSYDELLKTPPDPTPKKTMNITRRNASRIDPLTWGTVLEPIAIQLMEQTTNAPSVSLGLKIHDQYPFLGASPDGLQMIKKKPRLIEIKCPKKRQITYRVPVEYWVQSQIAMEVWNIDEVLYCEYKFDIATEEPTTKDLTITYGQLARGVYWIYQDSWHYRIPRDRAWFRSILPQIENFFELKFPRFTGPPGITVDDSGDRNHNSNIGKKRKRGRSSQQSGGTKRLKTRAGGLIATAGCTHHNTGKQMISVNKLSNFLRDDPILDWLEYHQPDHGYEKEKSLFLDFYNQRNLKFKLTMICQLIEVARNRHLSYQILNQSLASLLDIHNNNLLLKLQYDCHLINETQEAMSEGVDLIFMGQLGKEIGDQFIWDTFDVIIKREAFRELFDADHPFINSLEGDQLIESLDYIPAKIKFTTLDFRTGSHHLRQGRHKVDMIKIGAITSAIIIDRWQKIGIVPQHNDLTCIKNGLDWLRSVETTDLSQIWPNMKNRYDSQWSTAKSEIADDKDELTKISYMTVANREILHQRGIYKIRDLTVDDLEDLKYAGRIIPFISEELALPKLELYRTNKHGIEVYLDFESCSSLGTDEAIIFLMGILVKRGPEDLEYRPYLVENLNKESERAMLTEGLAFLKTLGKNTPVFHWSSAEPNLLSKAGFDLPKNCYWFDLYSHFVKNHASIPGCYTYGLKDVASSLYKLKKVQSRWLHGLDGNAAMTMAWNISHKCNITGDKFNEDPRIKKLCDYNYVDCVVMEEIRKLLDSDADDTETTIDDESEDDTF